MKDLVKRPQQKYDALFRELRMHHEESNLETVVATATANENDAMKTELKRYLMELNAPQSRQQPPHQQLHPQP